MRARLHCTLLGVWACSAGDTGPRQESTAKLAAALVGLGDVDAGRFEEIYPWIGLPNLQHATPGLQPYLPPLAGYEHAPYAGCTARTSQPGVDGHLRIAYDVDGLPTAEWREDLPILWFLTWRDGRPTSAIRATFPEQSDDPKVHCRDGKTREVETLGVGVRFDYDALDRATYTPVEAPPAPEQVKIRCIRGSWYADAYDVSEAWWEPEELVPTESWGESTLMQFSWGYPVEERPDALAGAYRFHDGAHEAAFVVSVPSASERVVGEVEGITRPEGLEDASVTVDLDAAEVRLDVPDAGDTCAPLVKRVQMDGTRWLSSTVTGEGCADRNQRRDNGYDADGRLTSVTIGPCEDADCARPLTAAPSVELTYDCGGD